MTNRVNISQNIINNYKNDINTLNALKLRIISGSCSIHDIVLYETLVKANSEEKKLTLPMNIGA